MDNKEPIITLRNKASQALQGDISSDQEKYTLTESMQIFKDKSTTIIINNQDDFNNQNWWNRVKYQNIILNTNIVINQPILINEFCGTFDGNGFSITGGDSLNLVNNSSNNNCCLFQLINNATIKNLIIKNYQIANSTKGNNIFQKCKAEYTKVYYGGSYVKNDYKNQEYKNDFIECVNIIDFNITPPSNNTHNYLQNFIKTSSIEDNNFQSCYCFSKNNSWNGLLNDCFLKYFNENQQQYIYEISKNNESNSFTSFSDIEEVIQNLNLNYYCLYYNLDRVKEICLLWEQTPMELQNNSGMGLTRKLEINKNDTIDSEFLNLYSTQYLEQIIDLKINNATNFISSTDDSFNEETTFLNIKNISSGSLENIENFLNKQIIEGPTNINLPNAKTIKNSFQRIQSFGDISLGSIETIEDSFTNLKNFSSDNTITFKQTTYISPTIIPTILKIPKGHYEIKHSTATSDNKKTYDFSHFEVNSTNLFNENTSYKIPTDATIILRGKPEDNPVRYYATASEDKKSCFNKSTTTTIYVNSPVSYKNFDGWKQLSENSIVNFKYISSLS